VNAVEELAGLRGLARALAHGDADDLLQDAAVIALEHPPATDRSVKPWLATVILNRWRMNRRSDARRQAREQAVEVEVEQVDPPNSADRARLLQRLSDALVALDEPFRSTVIAR
jgi:DNA-directed RNA polymerase specialized sigma24 family protein